MPMTCGGFDVLDAHVVISERGPAVAEVVLDTPGTAPPSSVVLAEVGGISLAMTVVRGAVNPALLRWEGVLVGGAGGLALPVIGAFQEPQVGDVLAVIAEQAGETLSGTIAVEVASVELEEWTLGQCSASAALDQLAAAAAEALGQAVTWRVLGDGSIWMGVETWPAATLPASAEVVEPDPMLERTVIAAEVAALLPGVDLAGGGRVRCVEHWVKPSEVRTWAWS